MSDSYELANIIRSIRGNQSQGDFGASVGLGIQVIVRLEGGGPCRFSTLKQIAERARVSPEQWSEMMVAWLKLALGKDFSKLSIAPKDSSLILRESKLSPATEAAALLATRSKKEQELILFFLRNPATFKLLPHIKELHENAKNSK